VATAQFERARGSVCALRACAAQRRHVRRAVCRPPVAIRGAAHEMEKEEARQSGACARTPERPARLPSCAPARILDFAVTMHNMAIAPPRRHALLRQHDGGRTSSPHMRRFTFASAGSPLPHITMFAVVVDAASKDVAIARPAMFQYAPKCSPRATARTEVGV